jgi:histidyl-tRNA synthetase
VFLAWFDAARLHVYLRLAAELRAAGLRVELYPEAKKLGAQLKYADRRGFRVALIAGESEFAAGQIQVKDLKAATSQSVSVAEGPSALFAAIRAILADDSTQT